MGTKTTDSRKHIFKDKAVKKTLNTRLASTVVLLILLASYVVSGALYTSLQTEVDPKPLKIAAYFSMFCSAVLVGGSTFELNRALGLKEWWIQTIGIILAIVTYIFPVTMATSQSALYYDWNLSDWFEGREWLFWVVLLFDLLAYLSFGYISKDSKVSKSSIAYLMVLIVALGYKGFTTTSLNLITKPNTDMATAQFSFTTILWVWMMIIFGDSFAYLGGVRFGKTKLAPKTSPKKTWEGAAIGVSSAFAGGVIFALAFHYAKVSYQPLYEPIVHVTDKSGDAVSVVLYIILSLVFPIIGIAGDLLFSGVKRYAGLKDYSNLIPGHGGILDRLDSFVVAMFVLFIFTLITA